MDKVRLLCSRGITWSLLYIDTLAGIGCIQEESESSLGLTYKGLLDAGLLISKEDNSLASLLGFELVDGLSWRPSRKHSWTVSRALQGFLEPHRLLSGRDLVGHATSMVLVQRDHLACCTSVNVFIQEFYNQRQHLWRSVLKE